jgi:hypothetical protein
MIPLNPKSLGDQHIGPLEPNGCSRFIEYGEIRSANRKNNLCKSFKNEDLWRAGDETRTRDIFLGKEVLYQLSYTRGFAD